MVPFDPAVTFFLAGLFAVLIGSSAARAEGDPGDFDFYVLALSWSPTYCALEGSDDEQQCGVERHGFIVHGLWPQYETGYPEFCRSTMTDRVSGAALESILDITPSAGLIRYQWRKHGLCTGLRQSDYFALMRRAFETISIREDFADPADDATLGPSAIEAAFLAANPGLTARGIAVTCKQRKLADVRICLTKDLAFRECREVDADACRSSRIDVPAVE
jgi:ribonuclease T2